MAEVIVNFDSKSYIVNNGVNKKGFKSDNLGGGTQRAFKLDQIKLNLAGMKADVTFIENDTDDVSGYESPMLTRVGTNVESLGSFITGGKLDLRALKIAILNSLFNSKLGIEPLETDGTVKVEYQ